MKLLPNINKSVPEAADPALIKPVSDAIEALDTALGAKPSTLTTTAKTLVGAINELDADTGYTTGTLTSSYHGDVTLHKFGRLVVIQTPPALTQSLPENTSTNIGTIPVGFRPVSTVVWVNPQVNASSNRVRIQILVDGTVSVYPYSTTEIPAPTELSLSGCYISA